jgi:hypothetical protein
MSCDISESSTDDLIRASTVATHFDITVRTLDRWMARPHMNFPKPAMVTHDVAGRVANRFWRVADVVEWRKQRNARHTIANESEAHA